MCAVFFFLRTCARPRIHLGGALSVRREEIPDYACKQERINNSQETAKLAASAVRE